MPTPKFILDLRQKLGHDLLLLPTIVVIVADRRGRILLVHDHDSDYWTLPGGIIEPGETPADTAVREVWEEAGVHVRLTRLLGVIGGPGCETLYSNGDRIAWVATLFAAEVDEAEPSADGLEARDAAFVSLADLPAIKLRADSQRFLATAGLADGLAYFQPASWHPA